MTIRHKGHNVRRRPCARANAGLTLIEVILSVTILSVGFAVLLTSVSRCLAVMKAGKNYQAAQWAMDRGELEHPMFLTNKVEDLEVQSVEYEGGLVFSRTVEDDKDEDDLYVVRTKVTWGEEGAGGFEEVVSCVYFRDPEKKK